MLVRREKGMGLSMWCSSRLRTSQSRERPLPDGHALPPYSALSMLLICARFHPIVPYLFPSILHLIISQQHWPQGGKRRLGQGKQGVWCFILAEWGLSV